MTTPRRLLRPVALLMLALAAIMTSCSDRRTDALLHDAEAIMEQHPDSALAILRGIDGSAIKGELRARHALLLSQALDKNFIDIADDSLINIAYNYYVNTSTNPQRRMMAFYYKGVTDFNNSNHTSAIYNFTIADSLASRIDNYRYRGLANSRMALSFSAVFDLRRDLEHSLRALHFLRLQGDSTHIINQLYTVGLCYDQIAEYDSAMVYFRKVGYDTSAWGAASSLIGLGRVDDFKALQTRYPKLLSEPRLQSRYARLLIKNHKLDEGEKILSHAANHLSNPTDSIQWIIAKSLLLKARGDWADYASCLEILLDDEIEQSHSIKMAYSPSSQATAQEFLYLADLHTEEHKRATLYLWLAIAIFIAIISILTGIIINKSVHQRYERQKLRLAALNIQMRRQNDSHNRDIKKIETEKEAWHRRALQLQAELHNNEETDNRPMPCNDHEYILERKQNLNTLFERYVVLPSTENGGQRIKLRAEIDAYNKPAFTDRLDNFINREYDNYIVKVKAANIPAKDLTLLRLLICRFSPQQISVIMDVNTAAIATRKSRLKDKIARLGLPEIPNT